LDFINEEIYVKAFNGRIYSEHCFFKSLQVITSDSKKINVLTVQEYLVFFWYIQLFSEFQHISCFPSSPRPNDGYYEIK
jgi:hypothetical protein